MGDVWGSVFTQTLRNSSPGAELTKQTNDANYPEILSQRSVQVGLNHLNCFRSKLFDKRPGLKALGGEKKEDEDNESSPSALVISTIDDEDILQVTRTYH